ncbi:MAG: HEAT repeat domain-containing protein, partial [Treponema sp.]|nr:HEAT repeat domain-containing protein [Treponema sp.]
SGDTEEEKEKRRDTIRFGLESEIGDLIDELIKKADVRYVDDVYDLFQDTKNIALKEKAMSYFAKLEDPCVEDFAITILDDPYDERQSTVNACFDYVKAVKTKEAVAPVLNLLESENEDYFNQCLDTLGKVGGSDEAVYLTEYLDREDLSVPQKQALVRVLGELKATETYDKLVEIAQDKDENTFMRMYSAEAIGAMGNPDAVPILLELYEDTDPNMRIYVIKGLSHFPQNADARKTIVQGIRDSYYKVRLEAINVVKEQGETAAVPYLIHRAKNDPEKVVKETTYPVLAQLNTKEGNDFLVSQITDKKVSDATKAKVAAALLAENNAGTKEILELAKEIVGDDMKNNPRKSLRYALGKEFAKYKRSEFADICAEYLKSKDVATQGTGLDIYNKGRYSNVEADVRRLAEQYDPTAKTKNPNAQKASKILGISEEEATKKAEKKKAEKDAEKAAKNAQKSAKDAQKKTAANEKKNPPKPAEKPDTSLDAK